MDLYLGFSGPGSDKLTDARLLAAQTDFIHSSITKAAKVLFWENAIRVRFKIYLHGLCVLVVQLNQGGLPL